MSIRWISALAALTVAIAVTGCSSPGQKSVDEMTEMELVQESEGTKIADWKDVGDSSLNAIGIVLVQDTRKTQAALETTNQQLLSLGEVAKFSRTVDKRLQEDGVKSPTPEQREAVERSVMADMPPSDLQALREKIAADEKLVMQRRQDLAVLLKAVEEGVGQSSSLYESKRAAIQAEMNSYQSTFAEEQSRLQSLVAKISAKTAELRGSSSGGISGVLDIVSATQDPELAKMTDEKQRLEAKIEEVQSKLDQTAEKLEAEKQAMEQIQAQFAALTRFGSVAGRLTDIWQFRLKNLERLANENVAQNERRS